VHLRQLDRRFLGRPFRGDLVRQPSARRDKPGPAGRPQGATIQQHGETALGLGDLDGLIEATRLFNRLVETFAQNILLPAALEKGERVVGMGWMVLRRKEACACRLPTVT
jgi:hypothetical protein